MFVPGMKKTDIPVDLERRVEEVEAKQGVAHRENSL